MSSKKDQGQQESKALVIVGDNPDNRKALMSRFGDEFTASLTIGQFIGIANLYGLNPFLGHCVAIHGNFYIEREGWLHIINRDAPGELIGTVDPRIGTADEYEQLRVDADNYLAFASVTRRRYPGQDPQTFTRHAIITKRETQPSENEQASLARGGKARHVVMDPWDMVMKQATVRVLRMAFNDLLLRLDLPGGERPTAGAVREVPTAEIEAAAEGPVNEDRAAETPGIDWSRLWAIAHEGGMDRDAVHAFFKVPIYDRALVDYAHTRAGGQRKDPVQIVSDMADELEVHFRGQEDEVTPADVQDARIEEAEGVSQGAADGDPE